LQHALGLLRDVPGIKILNSCVIRQYIGGKDLPGGHLEVAVERRSYNDEDTAEDQPIRIGGNHTQDPLRLTVSATGLGLTGYQVATYLEEEHGVVAELCTSKVVECQ
jgi:hypothetical protein